MLVVIRSDMLTRFGVCMIPVEMRHGLVYFHWRSDFWPG